MENSLKNVESDNNKILYETLFDFFTAKRNFLNKPRTMYVTNKTIVIKNLGFDKVGRLHPTVHFVAKAASTSNIIKFGTT